MKTVTIEKLDLIREWHPQFESEKLEVTTHSSQSMMQLARQNDVIHQKYLELLHHDFMLGEHKDGVSFFMQRSKWTWMRKDILKKHGIFYTVELPDIKYRNMPDNNLVVIFSFFGTDSSNAGLRTFPEYFPDIQKNIKKGTTILRIMDFNLSHGSFYLNTVNYPDFETNIQKVIRSVISEKNIDDGNVVLLGSSKGGTGALYHGLMGNWKSLSIDPITNDNFFVNEKKDWHFMIGSRELDFVPEMKQLAKIGNRQAIVVGDSMVPETFKDLERLNGSRRIKVYDTKNPLAYMHSLVGPSAKIEMVTLLNLLLDSQLSKWVSQLGEQNE